MPLPRAIKNLWIMSVNNTFSVKRFMRLFKQNYIHNSKFLLYAGVGYCGVVFIVLLFGQFANDMEPFGIDPFLQFLATFVAIFGILYIGYSFPSFRTKESSISYLTLPASTLEKFLFEFVNRVVMVLIVLPLLFWFTFNLEGVVFEIIGEVNFSMIGISDIKKVEIIPDEESHWLVVLITVASILALVLPFAGASMFSKQPLIKTLFSIAAIIIFYFGVTYIVVEPLGLHKYRTNESMWLVPFTQYRALIYFTCFVIVANITMMLVAYLKVKEREV